MKKKIKVILSIVLIAYLIYFIGTGFLVRSDVGMAEYLLSPNGNEMTINIGVVSSVGYTRCIKDVSKDPEKMELKCYSAFGGLNGSIGAESRFVISLDPECKEIYLYSFGEYRLEIFKDEKTGEWQSTREL